jgi:hypothetical protein
MRENGAFFFQNLVPDQNLNNCRHHHMLNVSIITTNNNGSYCLNPCELLKNLEGDPLMRMENRTVEMQ